jgi:hypothetical protein
MEFNGFLKPGFSQAFSRLGFLNLGFSQIRLISILCGDATPSLAGLAQTKREKHERRKAG